MTTELPSGETFTEGKLTELKNSSRVSLGFAIWAWARIEWLKTQAEIMETRERTSIDRRIDWLSPKHVFPWRRGKPRLYGCNVFMVPLVERFVAPHPASGCWAQFGTQRAIRRRL